MKNLKEGDIVYILGTVYSDNYSTVYLGKVREITEIPKECYDENGFIVEYGEPMYLIEVNCKKNCRFYIDKDWKFYKPADGDEEQKEGCRLWHRDSKVFRTEKEAKEYMKENRKTFYQNKINFYTKEIEIWKEELGLIDEKVERMFSSKWLSFSE